MSNLITICVPAYRRPGLLRYCLNSCLAQDYRPLEIDVGDNSPAGDDECERLVASLLPPPGITLRYRRNHPGGGLATNLNNLFAVARGDRLVLMNDDDALLPGAVSAMAEGFTMADNVVAAYGMLERITPEGAPALEETRIHNAHANRTLEQSGLRRDPLVCALWRQIPPIGFLIETEAARAVGYHDPSEIGLPVDADFGVRLALAYRTRSFAFVPHLSVQYRLPSPDGITARNKASVPWRLYELAAGLDGLTPEENAARDWLLRRLAHPAVVAHALGKRRRDALRILFSRHYPYFEGVMRPLYVLGLLAVPGVVSALRRVVGVKMSSGPAVYPPGPAVLPVNATRQPHDRRLRHHAVVGVE